METTVDKFGRVVIPKAVRQRLGLKAGTVLRIEETSDGMKLGPVHEEPLLVREGNVLVFNGRFDGDIVEAIQAQREERIQALARQALP